MSRIAKNPVPLPSGVQVSVDGLALKVSGPKGALDFGLHPQVDVAIASGSILFSPKEPGADKHAGTARATVSNMVKGVTAGFQKKLDLVGVGYRAQAQGKALNLTLGFSHPVAFPVPDGITIETPTPTEVIIKGADSRLVGQVAANIRRYRSPEPYKGKGIKYSDEVIVRKEAKKK